MMQGLPLNGGSRLAEGVRAVERCSLRVDGDVWPFAQQHAEEISAHWATATEANPRYFNGVVHLIGDAVIDGHVFEASLVRTDFKSYLYWRSQDFPEAGVLDGFGSGILRSADGSLILGRQRRGNVNS